MEGGTSPQASSAPEGYLECACCGSHVEQGTQYTFPHLSKGSVPLCGPCCQSWGGHNVTFREPFERREIEMTSRLIAVTRKPVEGGMFDAQLFAAHVPKPPPRFGGG
jgi:hypothetical protein